MHLIVGLGNPGRRYADSRHNFGFMVVDFLAAAWDIRVQSQKFRSLFGKGTIKGKPVLLVKPQTYMNLSGEAVVQWVEYYRRAPSTLLIVHDDLDLELGKMKLVRKGGDGGHKGMASIIRLLKSTEIPRLKLGIGRPRYEEPIDRFVLEPFYADERPLRDETIKRAAEAMESVMENGLDKAMNWVNQ